MAARSPRRSFASPFVITLAAAVPSTACYEPAASRPRPLVHASQATGQQEPTTGHGTTEPDTTDHGTTEPRPLPDGPPIRVNPPPPSIPRERRWTAWKSGGECHAVVQVQCPPNVSCNPPPPQAYPCPPGLADGQSVVVTQASGDDACFVQPEPPRCPPGVMCNPPAPQKVDCPK